MQKPVLLSTDSPAELPADLMQTHQIKTIPLYVNIAGRSLRDGIDITPPEIFHTYEQEKIVPTTSAIPVGEYQEHFAALTDGGKNAVVHFTIGGQISACYQNAVIAAQEFPGVFVVDSQSMSVGITLQLLHLAKKRAEGLDAAALAAEAEQWRGRVRTTALLGSVTYMRRSGRCSAVSAMGANLLGIRPVLGMPGGKLTALKKLRGKPIQVQKQYLEDALANPENIEPEIAFLYHSGVSPEEFLTAKALVEGKGIFAEVRSGFAGCITCTHCGDKCLIFMYATKDTAVY
ncbi:MAG: DegV family EDD domain-containing protein [Oscillospiraceae bacterium]|jgi:DegV family protein with EDD domain|nr:DegV family EDD domain-containing protein [Oscillospiraceae bacterium]